MGPGASLCFGRRIKWDSDRTDKINGDVAHPGLDSGPMAGSDFFFFYASHLGTAVASVHTRTHTPPYTRTHHAHHTCTTKPTTTHRYEDRKPLRLHRRRTRRNLFVAPHVRELKLLRNTVSGENTSIEPGIRTLVGSVPTGKRYQPSWSSFSRI